jgi:hypothetical protein
VFCVGRIICLRDLVRLILARFRTHVVIARGGCVLQARDSRLCKYGVFRAETFLYSLGFLGLELLLEMVHVQFVYVHVPPLD